MRVRGELYGEVTMRGEGGEEKKGRRGREGEGGEEAEIPCPRKYCSSLPLRIQFPG